MAVANERIRKRSFRRGRLSQQAVAEIERMLAEEFPNPGDRWPPEPELADRLGVSRIVVREAIKVMEDRGELETWAGRGTFTRAPNPSRVAASLLRLFRDRRAPAAGDMNAMLEIRQTLEETAAALAAVRATPSDIERMETALTGMAEGKAFEQAVAADLAFHVAVAEATHNRFFPLVLQPLTQVFLQQITVTAIFNVNLQSNVGIELHRDVLEQVRQGNPLGARQAMRRLMRHTETDLRRALPEIDVPAGDSQS
jgi:GntR family transcriptional repressor for pyruvate dehydrogenase complex